MNWRLHTLMVRPAMMPTRGGDRISEIGVPSVAGIGLFLVCESYIFQTSLYASRGEPTENIDGNYHRNKTIRFWSNGRMASHASIESIWCTH